MEQRAFFWHETAFIKWQAFCSLISSRKSGCFDLPKMSPRAQKSAGWLLVAAGMFAGFTGCEDSVRTPVQVKPTQIALPVQNEPLPKLPINSQLKYVPPLSSMAPDGPKWLAVQSQAAFDAGEQDFRAGYLGKARDEF